MLRAERIKGKCEFRRAQTGVAATDESAV
jgi:hypothetical protein